MGESKENIQKGVMGIVTLVFLIMTYVTFFSDKTPDEPQAVPAGPITTQPVIQPQVQAQPMPQAQSGEIVPLPSLVEIPSLASAVNRVFHPLIRDIFQRPPSPVPVPDPRADTPEKVLEPVLAAQDLEALKNALKFKGSVLYDTGAVAIINNAFFHRGDTINGHRIVFISEQEVWIDTTGGTLKLEILNYE